MRQVVLRGVPGSNTRVGRRKEKLTGRCLRQLVIIGLGRKNLLIDLGKAIAARNQLSGAKVGPATTPDNRKFACI